MLDEGYLLLVDISLYVYEQCNVLDKVVLCSNGKWEEANSSIRSDLVIQTTKPEHIRISTRNRFAATFNLGT
jgi:hypothetical protein